MTQNVNLNALRVFAAAAHHGNFQRAAEALNMSHGAVSQRIIQLERDLGVVLFARQARGVALTAQGKTYRTAVDAALSILETARIDVARASAQITFHLGPSFASKWLMPRMQNLAQLLPEVSITTEIHHRLLERHLGRNEIVIWPGKNTATPAAHHTKRLCDLHLVAVCSPTLVRPDGPMDMAALLSLPLLQDAHRRWDDLIKAAGDPCSGNVLNFDRSALALDAAIKGHGVAIAPTYMARGDIQAGTLSELWRSPTPSGEHLFMSWAKTHSRDKQITKVVNWVLGEFDLAPTP